MSLSESLEVTTTSINSLPSVSFKNLTTSPSPASPKAYPFIEKDPPTAAACFERDEIFGLTVNEALIGSP